MKMWIQSIQNVYEFLLAKQIERKKMLIASFIGQNASGF